MSSFNNSQRAPNVSRYLANLNQIPSAQDLGGQEFFDDPSMDPMANLDFFDFDSFNPDILDPAVATAASTPQLMHQRAQQQHQQQQTKTHAETEPSSPSNFPQGFPNFPDYGPAHPQIQSGYHPAGQRAVQQTQQAQQQYGTPSPTVSTQPSTGDKRKAAALAQMPSPAELEEVSRMAAEEDKRRRNTAASARFRVKKKQREQALEKQAKDMTDKVSDLEAKVQKLEMENKWLRELITDKKDLNSLDKFRDEHKEEKEIEKSSNESSTAEPKDGVGTASREEVAA